jgi:hypothetical protein
LTAVAAAATTEERGAGEAERTYAHPFEHGTPAQATGQYITQVLLLSGAETARGGIPGCHWRSRKRVHVMRGFRL